ncbi:MAG: bifunctional adenosylcobinamide kinase/adenosylcobinamide-phosphate guanylyltransferase, partial [Halioglobus sp.]|nr:bifunctional adenosylcobinamide kinase/adenosylcobinamide-phosphate guanylyltransferase [Halioglobus sp.]
LILGGARSGKSNLAEQRASGSGLALWYVATATAGDDEMAERIRHHQGRRGDDWQLVEAPIELGAALQGVQAPERCVVVDCLTLWLSNCLHQGCWHEQRALLFQALSQSSGHTVLVSNETGLGVVPMGALSRQFVDEAGFLHQQVAECCQQVTLTVAGLPVLLKSSGGN